MNFHLEQPAKRGPRTLSLFTLSLSLSNFHFHTFTFRENFHLELPAKRGPRTPTSLADFLKSFAPIVPKRGQRNGRLDRNVDGRVCHFLSWKSQCFFPVSKDCSKKIEPHLSIIYLFRAPQVYTSDTKKQGVPLCKDVHFCKLKVFHDGFTQNLYKIEPVSKTGVHLRRQRPGSLLCLLGFLHCRRFGDLCSKVCIFSAWWSSEISTHYVVAAFNNCV